MSAMNISKGGVKMIEIGRLPKVVVASMSPSGKTQKWINELILSICNYRDLRWNESTREWIFYGDGISKLQMEAGK